MKKPPAKRPAPAVKTDEQAEAKVVVTTTGWSGPLPPPSVLAEFDRVVENGAERIFTAFEAETRHRHKLERRDLNFKIFDTTFGKILASLFIFSIIGLCLYAIHVGAQFVALILGGGVISAVVYAFVQVNPPGK